MSKPKALLSWSSGKDSAWMLHETRRDGACEVVGLLTTLNGAADRVAMHGVRRQLLEAQAEAAGLPLYPVDLPQPCGNEIYLERVGAELRRIEAHHGITQVLFGDLFLADIRAWREAQMANLGLEPVFPLWGRDTRDLAETMVDGGLRAWLTCVDSEQLDGSFCGRRFDCELLADLPPDVDPCGENGEFHTLVTAGPMFSRPVEVDQGEIHLAGRFVYRDFLPA